MKSALIWVCLTLGTFAVAQASSEKDPAKACLDSHGTYDLTHKVCNCRKQAYDPAANQACCLGNPEMDPEDQGVYDTTACECDSGMIRPIH